MKGWIFIGCLWLTGFSGVLAQQQKLMPRSIASTSFRTPEGSIAKTDFFSPKTLALSVGHLI